MDLTGSENISNVHVTHTHKKARIGTHGDAVELLSKEMDRLEKCIQVVGRMGNGTANKAVALEKLNCRLIQVILDLSDLQEQQSKAAYSSAIFGLDSPLSIVSTPQPPHNMLSSSSSSSAIQGTTTYLSEDYNRRIVRSLNEEVGVVGETYLWNDDESEGEDD